MTLFQEDSPASHSLLPGSGRARRMTAISGRKCLELSKNSGPLGLLEKMLLESLEWHSTMCFLTWKTKVTPQGRLYYQLQVLEPCTGDIGQRLLPTLTASEWRGTAKNRYWGSHTYRSDKLASRFRTQSEDMTHINPDYAEVYMGFPMGWTVLDQLGNAVVPQQFYPIFQAIANIGRY